MKFEQYRKKAPLTFPKALQGTSFILKKDRSLSVLPEVRKKFSRIPCDSVQKIVVSEGQSEKRPLRVGVVLSGGQAPGGHNVVAGLYDALMEIDRASVLIGFLGGLRGIVQNQFRQLIQEEIDQVRNIGGFDLLGSGRMKISKNLPKAIETLSFHQLDGLVVIGGDDTNTDALYLAQALKECGQEIKVIGVPKTIDGDLRGEDLSITFGFDTACKVYSEIIGNISKDMVSSGKYYHFIRLMGRQASHITLECAMQTEPNIAFISEEVLFDKKTLQDVIMEIADVVEERSKNGMHYGLILVPEGLVEHMHDVKELISELNELFSATIFQNRITPSERFDCVFQNISENARNCLSLFPHHIAEELVHERDPHGNIQVSRIETERLLATLVLQEMQKRCMREKKNIPFVSQSAFLGYEGRSAYPSFFDCHYGYALGKLSAILIQLGETGSLAAMRTLHKNMDEWEPLSLPLPSLLHLDRRAGEDRWVIKRSSVDLTSRLFEEFSKRRASWRLGTCQNHPGPIQFCGPKEIVEQPCISIALG